MTTISGSRAFDLSRITSDLRAISDAAGRGGAGKVDSGGDSKGGFLEMLKDGLKEANTSMKVSDKASMDLASGRSDNIHETMLAAAKAELAFNMMVQLRNKGIEAYQEVIRMQV